MTAEQLRNSILQEAISGRLVPQDPNDEPASVLLQRIREEKARLVKAKQISKRDFEVLPITEDDVDFDIPVTWEWVRLGDIFKHSTGKALNEANKKGCLHDYITTSNVYWGYFKLDKLRQMYYTEDEKEKCMATKGDLLVLEGGDVGRAAIWDKDYDIFLQNHIHKLRAYIPVCTEFYYYCLYLFHDMGLVGGKGIGIQGLSSGALHQIIFPLPPLAEQQRIVAKLEELLPIVEQYGKAQKELDELNAALPARLRQSILQEAISGKLVPQDPNDEPASILLERMQNDKRKVIPIQDEEMPYEIPGSWEWVNLGSIVSIITGKKDANFGSEDGTYDFFTCSNTPIKCKSYSYDGDYLIMPGNGANIGKVIHYKGKFEAYQRTYLLQGYGNFDLDYLKYHLMCNWKEYNQDKLYGSAIPYIKLGNLMSYPVALPPLAEQQRIVAKIEELFTQIDKITK